MTRTDPASGFVSCLVLAAGGSRRLGRPKQLLRLDGEPLVRRAARAALGAGVDEAIVVVGARQAEVASALAGLPVRIAVNTRWREGMASSIQRGLDACTPAGEGAVLVALADQPLIGAEHLRRLVEIHRREGAALVATSYSGAAGVPALFAGRFVEALRGLEGDAGARGILAQSRHDAVVVPADAAALDVDTEADWEAVHRRHAAPATAASVEAETAERTGDAPAARRGEDGGDPGP